MKVIDILRENMSWVIVRYDLLDKNERYVGSIVPGEGAKFDYHFYKHFSHFCFKENASFYNLLQRLLYCEVTEQKWISYLSTQSLYLKDFDICSDEGGCYFEMEKDAISRFELVSGEFFQIKSEERRKPTQQELSMIFDY